ncbi:MAG: ATP-binding cassette domain-containing protein [Flavobacteriales bacterium]|nr:MAG: ATP-binding cassette domain-containing protein [Flavobacteriales bacterium]
MIKVKDLSKKFSLNKEQRKERNTNDNFAFAVKDISFECKPGEIFSLLGPNGAGKTTTLRMLSTVITPTSGSIVIGGVDAITEPQEARRKIGFLTGSTGLYARLNAHELIDYFASLYDVPNPVVRERKKYLFDLLDMNEFANKKIGKLSTGMKQKVSICRTMIHDPEIVIFDEPTSGLDVITAESIIQLIRDCKSQNKTVIFSSHIMGEVDLLCDRLAIIHKGEMKYKGSMESFREQMSEKSITAEFIKTVQA